MNDTLTVADLWRHRPKNHVLPICNCVLFEKGGMVRVTDLDVTMAVRGNHMTNRAVVLSHEVLAPLVKAKDWPKALAVTVTEWEKTVGEHTATIEDYAVVILTEKGNTVHVGAEHAYSAKDYPTDKAVEWNTPVALPFHVLPLIAKAVPFVFRNGEKGNTAHGKKWEDTNLSYVHLEGNTVYGANNVAMIALPFEGEPLPAVQLPVALVAWLRDGARVSTSKDGTMRVQYRDGSYAMHRLPAFPDYPVQSCKTLQSDQDWAVPRMRWSATVEAWRAALAKLKPHMRPDAYSAYRLWMVGNGNMILKNGGEIVTKAPIDKLDGTVWVQEQFERKLTGMIDPVYLALHLDSCDDPKAVLVITHYGTAKEGKEVQGLAWRVDCGDGIRRALAPCHDPNQITTH
jgi:hypothetical protein